MEHYLLFVRLLKSVLSFSPDYRSTGKVPPDTTLFCSAQILAFKNEIELTLLLSLKNKAKQKFPQFDNLLPALINT